MTRRYRYIVADLKNQPLDIFDKKEAEGQGVKYYFELQYSIALFFT